MSVATHTNKALKKFLFTALSVKFNRNNSEEVAESRGWRSLRRLLLDLSYSQACESILRVVSQRHSFSSLGWLERRGNQLETVFAGGNLHPRQMRLSVPADDNRLHAAVKREVSYELLNRESADRNRAAQPIHLFPIAIGRKISCALMVGDEILSENIKRNISRLCQTVASELEILRLREELSRRGSLERAVKKFNDSVKDIDTVDFWSSLVKICAELVCADRSSLLVFDEKSNSLSAKGTLNVQADIFIKESANLGERIARKVLQSGKPLVVEDGRETETTAAPVEWNYKSNSFISYPIMIGQRKIGVLNLTDRAGGEIFSELDLEILNAIMPQLAVLMDSAMLKREAGEFKHLSVTDALTGLPNRLYLDERLPEEIRRSNREGFPMSFLMIDVDDFKSYNDNFGHVEGDKALRIVADCLKDTMRGADVAARYGGEEFAILLPQTTLDGAATIGERIREKVATTEFPNRQITVSVGVASCSNTIYTAQEIVKWADDALYEAKRRGRNKVRIYIANTEINLFGTEKLRESVNPR